MPDDARFEAFAREYAHARRHLQRAIDIAQRHDPDHLLVAGSSSNLYSIEADLGLFERAEEHAERALPAAERTLGPRHHLVANVVHDMASLYRSEGDLVAARAHATRALELKREFLGEDHADTARAWLERGRLDLEEGALDSATKSFESALQVFERTYEDASLDGGRVGGRRGRRRSRVPLPSADRASAARGDRRTTPDHRAGRGTPLPAVRSSRRRRRAAARPLDDRVCAQRAHPRPAASRPARVDGGG